MTSLTCDKVVLQQLIIAQSSDQCEEAMRSVTYVITADDSEGENCNNGSPNKETRSYSDTIETSTCLSYSTSELVLWTTSLTRCGVLCCLHRA
jgi:hypothetical protein